MFDIVTKFTDYPSWVKFFVVLWVVLTFFLIMVQLFVKPIKHPENNQTTTTPINNQKHLQLSDKDKQKIIDEVTNNLKSKLSKEQQEKSVVFGIYDKHIILPKEQIPTSLSIDWSSAKVVNETNSIIDLMFPTIKGAIKNGPHMEFFQNVVGIDKKIGKKVNHIKTPNFQVTAEIIDIKNGLVIFLITATTLP